MTGSQAWGLMSPIHGVESMEIEVGVAVSSIALIRVAKCERRTCETRVRNRLSFVAILAAAIECDGTTKRLSRVG